MAVEGEQQIRRLDLALMLAIVAIGGLVTILVGERIGINGGQGWDGISYTAWAQDFSKTVLGDGLTRFHSQRVLPSAIVHVELRAFGIGVIRGFQILDLVALAGTTWCWGRICVVRAWSRPASWAGFVALMINHASAKHALYYPTLTDPTALLLGMVMVWAAIARKPIVLWLVMVASMFTWPALPVVVAAFLVCLPIAGSPEQAEPVVATTRWKLVAAALGLATAAAFVTMAIHYWYTPVPHVGDDKFAQWVHDDLLGVTIIGLVVMLAGGTYTIALAARGWLTIATLRGLRRRQTILAIVSIGLAYVVRAIWLGKVARHGEGPSTSQFLCELGLTALRGPLWGPVHHVVYYGPIIAIAILAWKRIASVCRSWGPPALVALAMTLVFAAGSNSRQWSHLFPFLVVVTIAATHELWTWRRLAVFAVVALAWSKVWLVIGYDHHIHWWQWPVQRYFMNQGPYANDTMYIVHGICALATVIILRASVMKRDGSRLDATRAVARA